MRTVRRDRVPTLTRVQMQEVDRAMEEDFGISLVQMMENAGRSLAEVGAWLYAPRTATVLAGRGGNGGGGLAAARHLANRGVEVAVVLSHPGERLRPVPERQLEALRRMGVPIVEEPVAADLVVDALLGYSVEGDPHGRTAELIEWANSEDGPVLSVDLPSGLDPDTGRPGEPCIGATATMTLALPKRGLLLASERTGRLFLTDLSVPHTLYARMGIEVPSLFGGGPVVELTTSSSVTDTPG